MAVALAACSAPDVIGVAASYGENDGGLSPARRPVTSYASEGSSWAVMPFMEWHIGERSRHDERRDWHEDTLAAHRRLEVTAATGKLQPVVVHDHGDEDDSTADGGLPEAFTKPPRGSDEVIGYLVWVCGLTAIGLLAIALKRAGFKLPFTGKG